MAYWIGILLVFLLSLVVFRYFVHRDYNRRGSLTTFSTFLEFLVFGLYVNLPYLYLRTPWPSLPPLPANTLQIVLGLGFMVLGIVGILAIMAYLGFSTTMGVQPGQLRQSGPYRWSRNPQLLTFLVLLLGFVILYPSWQALSWTALYGTIAHIMVLTEEEHLSRVFKEEYQLYCRQVPRYFRFSG